MTKCVIRVCGICVALFTKACTLFVVELQLKKIPQFMGVLLEEKKDIWINLIFTDMNEISHLQEFTPPFTCVCASSRNPIKQIIAIKLTLHSTINSPSFPIRVALYQGRLLRDFLCSSRHACAYPWDWFFFGSCVIMRTRSVEWWIEKMSASGLTYKPVPVMKLTIVISLR